LQVMSREVSWNNATLNDTVGVLIGTFPLGRLYKVDTEIVDEFDGTTILTTGTTANPDAYQDSGDITEGTIGFYEDVVSGAVPARVVAGAELRLFKTSGTPTQGIARVTAYFFSHQSTDPSN
jgi:hypothetical protein